MSSFLEEKIAKIKTLDEAELKLLSIILKDQDISVEELSKAMQYSTGHTKTLSTSVYYKLGVPKGHLSKRAFIYNNYYEAYKVGIVGSLKTVSYSETVEPEVIQGLNVRPPQPRVNQRFRIVAVLAGFFVISLVVIGVLLSIIRNLNRPAPVQATSERPTETQVVVQPTDIPVQVFQPTQPAPTQPESTLPPVVKVEPTDTPTLVPTAQPTPLPPAIPLPFSDPMTTGFSSAWKVLSGNWISADGKTTITDENHVWGTIVLDDPRWVNYKINFTVKSFNGSFDEIIVYLRYQSDQTKF